MKYIVRSLGGRPLSGSIALQGAKNSMLNNLCVPMLTDEECTITNVPLISDITLNLDILASFGAEVRWRDQSTVSVKCSSLRPSSFSSTQSVLTTGSKLFIPMMVARFGEYRTGPSRGCRIGDRQFLQYAKSLENFGIGFEVNDEEDYRFFRTSRVEPRYRLPFPSFGLTVNALLAASALNFEVTLENTCLEPEIDSTIAMINLMGGSIRRTEGTINIARSKGALKGCTFRNLSDRNAAVTYAAMTLAAGGQLTITNFDDIKMEAFYSFLTCIGALFERGSGELRILGRTGSGVGAHISAFLYPEFHSDWQPLISVILTQLNGESYVEEKLFPKRLEHWKELGKMGAKYTFHYGPLGRFQDADPHAVSVFGPTPLNGAHVVAENLRAGAALVAAALVATGDSVIENAEEIERGYQDMPDVLCGLGADVAIEP